MNEKSPIDKGVSFSKRTTAKFRSMDLTSQSLGRINGKLHGNGDGSDRSNYNPNFQESKMGKEWGKKH